MTTTVLTLGATTTGVAGGSQAITVTVHDGLKLGPPDVFPLPPEPFPITITYAAADDSFWSDTAAYQARMPTANVGLDLQALQQDGAITVPLATSLATPVPFTITPSSIQMFSGDTGPILRFLVVDGETGAPIDLTGATIQFLVKRLNSVDLAFPSSLSGCTNLPNPTKLAQKVVGSGTGQSVLVDTTTGTGLVNNGPMNVGLPSATNYESIASVGTPDSTHLFGIFVQNHDLGEPVVEANTTSPDPVFNARGGYCLYSWPQGAPTVPATYQGQLKITLASGVVEHSALLTIVVQEGF